MRCGWAAHRQRAAVWVLAGLAVVLGFWRLESQADLIVANRRHSDAALCAGINDNRAVLQELILRSTTPQPIPAGTSPELRAAYERAREQAAAFRYYAEQRLQPTPCRTLVGG